jgi:hypothetical protein
MAKFLPMVYLFGGGLLALFGALFTLGLAPRMDLSHGRSVVDLLGLLAFGLVPLAVGLGGAWYGIRRLTQARQAEQVEHDASLTRTILQRVRAQPQGITPQEVAINTPFSPQEVEAKLGTLYVDGVLEMEVTDEGKLLYKPKVS